jgi:hypothetical protein
MSATLRQGVPVSRWWPAAIGGRTPVQAAGRRRQRHTLHTSLATHAGHQLSGRRSFRNQRTVNPLIALCK